MYQATEYDCGTTSLINALIYLYDREEIPVEFLKTIYRLSLDAKSPNGITGEEGTSNKHIELIAKYFINHTKAKFNINCEILHDANTAKIKATLVANGVAVACCWQQETEHSFYFFLYFSINTAKLAS